MNNSSPIREIDKKNKKIKWVLVSIAIAVIPLVGKIVPKPSIIRVDLISDIPFPEQQLGCYFIDSSFTFKETGYCKFSNDSNLIYSIPSSDIVKSYQFIIDFGNKYIDNLHIDSMRLYYSDGKKCIYSMKDILHGSYTSYQIKSLTYNKHGGALFTFEDSDTFDPHIVMGIDKRLHSNNRIIVLSGVIALLFYMIIELKLKKEEFIIYCITFCGYLSSFSTIILNNVFIILICLYAIYHMVKKANPVSNNLIVLGFIMIFAIKIIWSFYPDTSYIHISKYIEKYMTFLFIPLAFRYIPLEKNALTAISKIIVTSCVILLYINLLSIYIYIFPQPFNMNSYSYNISSFFHSPDFSHSSYIAFFYSTSVIFSFYLYNNDIIKFRHIIILQLLIILFSFLSGARIGLAIGLFLFVSMVIFIKSEIRHKRRVFSFVGIMIIIIALIFPFSNFLKSIDPVRNEIWEISRSHIKSNLLIGDGTGGDKKLFNSIDNYHATLDLHINNAHNQILNDMIEHGIIFGSTIYIFLTILLLNANKKRNPYLFLFICCTLLFMTTEVITDRSRGLIFVISCICILNNFVDDKGTNMVNS